MNIIFHPSGNLLLKGNMANQIQTLCNPELTSTNKLSRSVYIYIYIQTHTSRRSYIDFIANRKGY